jgi:hypothetical protein
MNNPIFTFAHSAEILAPIVDRYGCGWFDGGCFIFARALQLWLGGCLAVLVRQELWDEQVFDHVILRVENIPDSRETLYIDADGVATRSALLERWRTRDGLTDIRLEDPASATRFVGHLHNDSLSIWLADELRSRFGIPARNWLASLARGGVMTQISGDANTIAGFNAGKYIASIRSGRKREYARKYLAYILRGRSGSCPGRGVASAIAAQAVRTRLDQIFQETSS